MQAQGEYTNKENNETVNFDFSYTVIDNLTDAISELGEDTCKSLLQRMIKTDARNNASLKAQSANGHNARAGMSEEQKAEKKAERKTYAQIIQALKAKGITSVDDIDNLV